ncbi:transposase [Streptomyces sp. Tu 3180]|uniref:transposase n=1 Tax=Streptomyces sp. Tu 3180 TaxID=2682611 RepID=UPI001AA02A63|nr:transposase [Streptomyces sp. Tu 3180]
MSPVVRSDCSAVSDARWASVQPVFTAWRARRTGPGTVARAHDLREIVTVVPYVNRTGIPWEHLPHDFPEIPGDGPPGGG